MSETRASEVLSMEVVVADGLSGYGPGEVIGWTDGRLLVRRGRREWHLGPDASVDLSEDGEVIVADVADPDRFLRLRFGPATGATFTNRVGWLALVGTAVLAGAWLGDMRVLAAALVVAAISAVWSWRSNDESLQRQTFIDHAELVGHGSVTMGSGGDETWVPVLPLAGPVDRRSRRLEDVERFALGLAGFVVSAMAPYPFTGGGLDVALSGVVDMSLIVGIILLLRRAPVGRLARELLFAVCAIGLVWVPHMAIVLGPF